MYLLWWEMASSRLLGDLSRRPGYRHYCFGTDSMPIYFYYSTRSQEGYRQGRLMDTEKCRPAHRYIVLGGAVGRDESAVTAVLHGPDIPRRRVADFYGLPLAGHHQQGRGGVAGSIKLAARPCSSFEGNSC